MSESESVPSTDKNANKHPVKESLEDPGYQTWIREAILGYLFWTLCHALGPMIWYYPLQTLDVTGLEAFCIVYFAPVILGIGFLHRIYSNRWVMALLRMTMLLGLGSFHMPTTLLRLESLSLGTGSAMMVVAIALHSNNPQQRYRTIWGLLLGFAGLLVSRVWFITIHPAWWSWESNAVITGLCVIAVLDKIFDGDDGYFAPEQDVQKPDPADRPFSFSTGVGLGCLLFVTQAMLGEVSVITRYAYVGYPSPGPLPFPMGFVVLLCLVAGMTMSGDRFLVTFPAFWLIGSAALAALYWLDSWNAFIGGLILAFFVGAAWPEMLERVSMAALGKTFFFAVLTYLGQKFFQVWTVAYNFVPGGEYTREHTDWLIGSIIIGLGFGLLSGSRKLREQPYSAFLPTKEGPGQPSRRFTTMLVLILLAGAGGFAFRYPNTIPPDRNLEKADPNVFSATMWAFRFAYDNQGKMNLERAAQIFNESGTDAVCMVESDASKPFLGNNDPGLYFAEKLGMYVDFGPSTKTHTWGSLLVSKYPIIESSPVVLPSPEGENAPATVAVLSVNNRNVTVICAHMGNDRDTVDRKLQAKSLSEFARQSKNPVILLAYVTSKPGSRDYKQLTEYGGLKDIDATDRDRWCLYIMYKDLIRLGYARISHGGLSDTELQMARFVLPEDPNKFEDHDHLELLRSNIKNKNWLFSEKFGNHTIGHFPYPRNNYHMSTPKYFLKDKPPPKKTAEKEKSEGEESKEAEKPKDQPRAVPVIKKDVKP